ncbi:MAG: hypothetical protein DCC68_06850 [Planctomycetota bacterium]|nr:MAG: hypothetical protein DCC68_06850 [Planctomycetota bacterium]
METIKTPANSAETDVAGGFAAVANPDAGTTAQSLRFFDRRNGFDYAGGTAAISEFVREWRIVRLADRTLARLPLLFPVPWVF